MDKSWLFLRHAKDEDIPLLEAALLIAKDEYPDLNFADYEALMVEYSARLHDELPESTTPAQLLHHLNGFLFDELGFAGDAQDYYNPSNNYINQVLERRLGNPVSLAVVQMELAKHLGVPLEGVSFPGHFLVRLPLDEGLIVLDPYQKGRSLDAAELRRRARTYLDSPEIDDNRLAQMLAPASHRDILARMLRNLKAVYNERSDWDKALRCSDRLLTVDPHQPSEYRDRGTLYFKMGHLSAAREDLRRYLALAPHADDSDAIRLQLTEASLSTPRLN